MTTNLHAHVSTESADCDGRHGYDYVARLTDEEIAEHERANGVNDFHDLHFKERVLGGIVSFHAECKVNVTPEGFHYVESTDEGYRAVEVQWCEDDCDDASSQYDQYAEMMGY